MDKLMETSFIKLVSGENHSSSNNAGIIGMCYKEFALEVANLCRVESNEMPAWFTLNYTRIELNGLLNKLIMDEGKKKWTNCCVYN